LRLLWVKFRRWWVYDARVLFTQFRLSVRGVCLNLVGRCYFCAERFHSDPVCPHCNYDPRGCHHCNKIVLHMRNYSFGQNLDKIARGEMRVE